MPLAVTTLQAVFAIVVPLTAALIGATAGAWASRFLRREELYVEAALKIEGYMEETTDLIKMAHDKPADLSPIARAEFLLTRARFHNKRLDSDELDERLAAAQAVATDIFANNASNGLDHLSRAVSNSMEVVIVYMKLPSFWRGKRKFRESYFPTRDEYQGLIKDIPHGGIDYSALNKWQMEKDAELAKNEGRE
jgi:hypothetical protein